MHADLLRRFTPTPFEAYFKLRGTVVRLETNCQIVADQMAGVLPRATADGLSAPSCLWRVVAESETDLEAAALSQSLYRLSDDGLAFIGMGQKSFLAYDRRTREGIAFIPERVALDEGLFREFFLPAFVSLLEESTEVKA